MSADNGIYVLETKGPQWRVTYAQGIDNIYGDFSDLSYQWQGDPEEIYKYFHDSPVFLNYGLALDYAEELSYNYDYLEYGICVVSNFKEWDFNRLKERYGKEAEGNPR
jgi:hypothetical protein